MTARWPIPGGTSKGGSIISAQSDGNALLRVDHTELFDKAGKPAGGFHQTMLIYPDNGAIRADYVMAKATPSITWQARS
jgi:hypothetical protein